MNSYYNHLKPTCTALHVTCTMYSLLKEWHCWQTPPEKKTGECYRSDFEYITDEKKSWSNFLTSQNDQTKSPQHICYKWVIIRITSGFRSICDRVPFRFLSSGNFDFWVQVILTPEFRKFWLLSSGKSDFWVQQSLTSQNDQAKSTQHTCHKWVSMSQADFWAFEKAFERFEFRKIGVTYLLKWQQVSMSSSKECE
jgi:hypothetical protein